MVKRHLNRFLNFLCGIPKYIFIKSYSFFLRTRIFNLKNIPKGDSAILAINHITGSDPILVLASLKKKIVFIADSKLFATKLTNFFFRKFADSIPIFKEEFLKNTRIFKELFSLKNKENLLLGIFPEGKLNKKGDLEKFFKGTAYISYKTKIPIIPVYISNIFKGPSRKSWFGRNSVAEGIITIAINIFKRIHIYIGNPIDPTAENIIADFDDLTNKKAYKEILKSINQELEDEFLQLEEQSNYLSEPWNNLDSENKRA